MDSPVTLRLDKETRERIGRIAERKRVSASEVIREAIEAFMKQHEVAAPYERAADLMGVVHGGDPKRSQQTGRRFAELVRNRGRR